MPASNVMDLIKLLSRPTPDEERAARVLGAQAKLRDELPADHRDDILIALPKEAER